MNVVCTQSKTCEILSTDVSHDHRKFAVFDYEMCRCTHKDNHNHTPMCEIKCCDQRGIVKCRNAE